MVRKRSILRLCSDDKHVAIRYCSNNDDLAVLGYWLELKPRSTSFACRRRNDPTQFLCRVWMLGQQHLIASNQAYVPGAAKPGPRKLFAKVLGVNRACGDPGKRARGVLKAKGHANDPTL